MTAYQNALVTGATGFVGGHFLSRLISSLPQLAVCVGGRAAPVVDGGTGARVQFVLLDMSRELELGISPDIVFHIAGEKRVETRMWDVNLEGTRRLLDWSAVHGVKRFVYLSSVGVYGVGKNFGVVTEDTPKCPNNTYEASKNAAEELVKERCRKCGIEYVILQPSNVIGWADGKAYPLLGMMKMIKRGWFTYFGGAPACFNYVAVEDVAAGLVAAALPQAANRVFILNSPVPMKQAVDWIADELGVAHPARSLPALLGRVAAGMADALSGLTGRSLPFGRERFRELTNTTRYEGSAISAATGFAYPTGIEGAIRGLTRRYMKEGLL